MFQAKPILHGLSDPFWFWSVLITCGVALTLIIMLMRYERKLVSRKVGMTLLLMRIFVVVVLFLTLMQPVISWTLDREDAGRIILAIDLSESMSTKDSHAQKAEKLRWARALGMIGNEKTNARIDRWIEDFQAGREPRWIDKGEAETPAAQQQLIQSRKENLENVFKKIDSLSRKDMALRLLTKGKNPLFERLKKIGDVDVVVFGGKVVSAEGDNLENVVEKPPESVQPEISDLFNALSPANASNIAGVILLTDGRETTERANNDVVAKARRLGQDEIPIFPVRFGSLFKPVDISIGELTYPEKARRDKKAKLVAKLNAQGFAGKPLKIVLNRTGAEPLEKTITYDPDNPTVDFDLDTKKIGRHEYSLRAEVQEGETRKDNNEKKFAMNVVAEKVRVLLVEGEARWEFRFIDNALSRDEAIEMKRVVFKQPYLGVLSEGFFPKDLKLPAMDDDLENSPFAEPDMVILGDVSPAELPEKGWKLLERFVGEAGGTLVMIAGKNHFPREHHSPLAQALLPVTNLRPLTIIGQQAETSPVERGFHLKLTPEALREPMFQFEDDEAENKQVWSELPGHTWGLLGTAKKGATVFATAIQQGQPQTLEDERNNAVIVHQHYGFGQVLWIGLDSTWRWRYRVGDKYHHRFWGQVGLWGASKIATTGNKFVEFGPEHSDIQFGEDAVLRARWSKLFLQRHPDLNAKIQIFRADDEQRDLPFSELSMTPHKSRPLVYVARAIGLPAGKYKVRLVVENANIGNKPLETDLFVKEVVSRELQDLSSNQPLLKQLADESHGKLLELDEINQLPSLLTNSAESRSETPEFRFWDHWTVMLLFFTLLTIEWVVRKVNGLP